MLLENQSVMPAATVGYVLVSDKCVPFLLYSVMTSMADAQLLLESEH